MDPQQTNVWKATGITDGEINYARTFIELQSLSPPHPRIYTWMRLFPLFFHKGISIELLEILVADAQIIMNWSKSVHISDIRFVGFMESYQLFCTVCPRLLHDLQRRQTILSMLNQ